MLARTGFKRPVFQRAPPSKPAMCRPGVRMFVATDQPDPVPKEPAPVRSEVYRRLVAAMPCKHCGLEKSSQAAHPPPTAKSRKECDLETFPLCCTRPGVNGCHVDFDQYRLMPKEDMALAAVLWAAETRAEIRAAGMWPHGLAYPR